MEANYVNTFKAHLDKFWLYEEVMFDFTADLIVEPETDQFSRKVFCYSQGLS